MFLLRWLHLNFFLLGGGYVLLLVPIFLHKRPVGFNFAKFVLKTFLSFFTGAQYIMVDLLYIIRLLCHKKLGQPVSYKIDLKTAICMVFKREQLIILL